MRPTNHGEGRLKAVLSLAFLAAVVFCAIKVIPVYVNNYELTDYIQTQNPFWLTQRESSDAVRDHILTKAQDLGLPVQPEDVKVEATHAIVSVSVDYTVPINLLVYTLTKRFQISAENRQL
jgi:hypothetical protein